MGSKRIKGKNIKKFFGKPIFLYTVEHAKNCGLFDEIHISTESEELVKLCEQIDLKPEFLRPEHLATETTTLQEVFEFVLEEYSRRGKKFEEFCILWATAPMRTAQDILNSYKLLTEDFEGVVGVTDYNLPFFCAQKMDENKILDPLYPDILRNETPSNQMPYVVCDCGSLCWVKTDAFLKHKTWLPPKIKGYHLPRSRSVDIDTKEDWELAEYLFKKHFKIS